MGTRSIFEVIRLYRLDHPHAYGDKGLCLRQKLPGVGSSPRVWGQASDVKNEQDPSRIIPTRMGTSPVLRCRMLNIGDHPHAYGDKVKILKISTGATGSSPRVWGQVHMEHLGKAEKRIIPTRMGTRKSTKAHSCKLEDHPHAYGDKQSAQRPSLRSQGSSPRVWGQVDYRDVKTNSSGIIPTRMGTSLLHGSKHRGNEDHPHAYGDKITLCPITTLVGGSSPRVWGQATLVSSAIAAPGIIPTRMGTRTLC